MIISTLLRIVFSTAFCCLFIFNASAQTVAILDAGINITKSLSVPSNRIVGQRCFSKEDEFIDNSSLYRYISLCPNGSGQDLSNSSATIPRNFRVRFGDSPFVTYPFGIELEHGNLVSNALHSFNSTVRHKPIQIFFYDQNFFAGSSCLFRNGQNIGCYNSVVGDEPITVINALRHLALSESNSISAVVISSTLLDRFGRSSPPACRQRSGQQEVNALYSKGIAVVVALRNETLSSSTLSWPNCLDNVINVGNGSGAPIGIGRNGIDFYAWDRSGTVQGNSFSAPRIAGAMALLHQANPNSTVPQKIDALTRASNSTRTVSGITKPYIQSGDMSQAIDFINNPTTTPPTPTPTPPTGGGATNPNPTPRPPTPAGQTASLGITDDTLYTQAVTFFVNLNGSASPTTRASSNVNIPVSDLRDIRLDFDGLFYTSVNPSSLAGIDIVVNGVPRVTFNSLIHSTHQRSYRKHSFMLNRNWLKSGDNTIEIKKSRLNRSSMAMRVTKVRMEYNSPLNMKFGQTLTSLYGHRVGSKRHLTGMRVTFSGSQSDVDFSVRGFDIDTNTEIAVFLNNTRVGYLNRSANGGYNTGNNFKFRKDDLVSSGINTIEFVQTSSSDSETWGVTNLKLDGASPDISGIIMMLLSDD